MINFGFIGFGMIGERHYAGLMKTGKAKVSWVAARSSATLEKAQLKFNIDNTTTNYHELLADPSIDAVVICTPPHLHLEMLTHAVKAGKHVLLEKPVAIKPSELDQIRQLRAEFSANVIMDCSGRHARLQPKFDWVKQKVQNGHLGNIYAIHHNAVFRQSRPGIEYHPDAKWFLDRQYSGGGPMIDWGVYDLSFHLGILNDQPEIEEMMAFSRTGLDRKHPGTDTYNVEEHASAMMKFSNELTYYWERAAHANVEVPNETRVYGDRGGLKFAYLSWDNPVIEFYRLNPHQTQVIETEIIEIKMPAGHDDEAELSRHFIEVLLGNEKPVIDLDTACKHMDIIFRLYQQTATS